VCEAGKDAYSDKANGITAASADVLRTLPGIWPADLQAPARKWTVGGTPLLSMMHLERRAGW
jgi:hypothetical protein